MSGGDRIGQRAYAWSEADRAAILRHFIDLMIMAETMLGLLRNSAYGAHMKPLLDEWEALLDAAPPLPGQPRDG